MNTQKKISSGKYGPLRRLKIYKLGILFTFVIGLPGVTREIYAITF